ncbi:MAG: hypothetical protein IJH41_04350 [Eubacterium sp.]|nr:hypothetical protein [Eubacterium sp.]
MIKRTGIERIIYIAASVLIEIAMTVSMMAIGTENVSAADLSRQTASSGTATIKMSKTLTVNQNGKFPAVTDFNYSLERVSGWVNANTSSASSGAALSKSSIPMPAASSTASHSITVSGDTATVAIGNFSGSDAADTQTVKNRYTDVPITFTQAGYYLYKVTEASSTPATVPGVVYDDHEYFICVYVCNNMDSNGNTIDGVYVHSMTAYRNTSGSTTYQPDLSDIAYETDNGDAAALENNQSNLGKVGISSAASPNILRADNMWNTFTTSDLTVTNNVQGTLGDRSKAFEFTVTLSGLENSKAYQLTGDVVVDTVTTGTYDDTADTITTSASGQAVFTVKLRDDEGITVEGLNATSQYVISEGASDHIPSYAITAEGGNSAVIASAAGSRQVSQQALATSLETVDAGDSDQTVAFQNSRDLAALTGTRTSMLALMTVLAVLIIAAAAYLVIRKASADELK